jgi:hypothetical protein
MVSKLSPKQALVVYCLIFTGDEPTESELRPKLKPKEIKELLEEELIELFKKPKGRSDRLRPTDKAWLWADRNLGTALSTRSAAGTKALQYFLRTLGKYLRQRDATLTEILMAERPTILKISNDDIRSAYLELTGGSFNVPVRVADLGKSLPQVTPSDFIALLLKLHADQRVFFARLDDPQSVTEEDRRFAVEVDGHEKHLVAFRN